MLIAEKMCFLYAPDLEEYRKNERGLYFEPEQLPFYISSDTGDLVSSIINSSRDEYLEKVKSFSSKVNMYENGTASDALAEIIRKRISQ